MIKGLGRLILNVECAFIGDSLRDSYQLPLADSKRWDYGIEFLRDSTRVGEVGDGETREMRERANGFGDVARHGIRALFEDS